MAVYWSVFLIPLCFYLLNIRSDRSLFLSINILFFIVFTIFVGLRFEVGGDWGNYLDQYFRALYYRNLILLD